MRYEQTKLTSSVTFSVSRVTADYRSRPDGPVQGYRPTSLAVGWTRVWSGRWMTEEVNRKKRPVFLEDLSRVTSYYCP